MRQLLGRAYRGLGDHQLALAHAERSVALRSSTDDREGDAYSLHWLAVAYQAIGDHQQTIELCAQAIDVARTYTVFPPQPADTLDTLATSLQHTGDHLQAIACLHEALRIYEQFNADSAAATRHRLQALKAVIPKVTASRR